MQWEIPLVDKNAGSIVAALAPFLKIKHITVYAMEELFNKLVFVSLRSASREER